MFNWKFSSLLFELLLFVMLTVFSQVSMAEDDAIQEVTEEDYIGEIPRVLTVSRLSQSIADAPSAVTVIDRETIRASGIVDLPEIFRLVPGFYVGTNAGFVHNTNHTVSYHGMTTAYSGSMQVLINGRSVYSPLYGGVQWSELPIAIADIDHIEITRGPNAASYGANSFFGVINIITQSPADQKGTSISATYGNGRHEAFARYADKYNDLTYRITAGYRDDDGLDKRYDFKRTRILNAQADYRLDQKNSFDLELGIVNGNRDDDETLNTTRYFEPRSREILNHYELIRWRHNVNENNDFSLQAYHSHDLSDDRIDTVNLTPPFMNLVSPYLQINNDIELERYDIEAQHNVSFSPLLRGIWGVSARQDNMYSPHYLGNKKTDHFDLQRLFGHAEWRPVNKLVFNIGAMLEHNDFTGTNTSPRASLNFKLSPNHTLRFGVSKALRTPNYLEEKFNSNVIIPTVAGPNYLAAYFADTGNLDSEKITSKGIGYLGDFGKLKLDTRIFRDEIKDYIQSDINHVYIAPPGYYLVRKPRDFKNAGDVDIRGFEAQAKWAVAANTNLLLNYAYMKINADEKKTSRNITMSMPRNTVSALLTHRFDSLWDASLAYYQTSEVAALGDGNYVDLARRTDVRLARQFKNQHLSGEVSAVVENLFNEYYEEFADYNTLKRRARINVRLDF